MKEILEKYYLIKVDDFKILEDSMVFDVAGVNYLLIKTGYDEKYLKMLVDLQAELKSRKNMLHDFVLNKDGLLLSNGFVLLKVNCLIDEICIEDIKGFALPVSDNIKKEYLRMENFWENKIDYLEVQLSELSNNILINNSFDYYVGIAEILISFLKKQNDGKELNLVLSHKIFKSKSTIDFYNPLYATCDLHLRDIAYYIRINNDWDLLYNILDNYKFSHYEYAYFFVRMVFPFEYFSNLEDILIDKKTEDKLLDIINNNKNYEKYLLKMQEIFGIWVFSWLRERDL